MSMLNIEMDSAASFEDKYIAQCKAIIDNPYLAVENAVQTALHEMAYQEKQPLRNVEYRDSAWYIPKAHKFSSNYMYVIYRGQRAFMVTTEMNKDGSVACEETLFEDEVKISSPINSYERFLKCFNKTFTMSRLLDDIIQNKSRPLIYLDTAMALNESQQKLAMALFKIRLQ